jgi:hypothetical protein
MGIVETLGGHNSVLYNHILNFLFIDNWLS